MMIEARANVVNNIGRLGENDARIVKFYVGDILKNYPEGIVFSLLNIRPNDPAAYPVYSENFTVSGDWLYWTVKDSDVAQQGGGECQIVASKDGLIVKTEIYRTIVDRALDGSGTPPEPWESWVEQVETDAENAKNSAERAETAAQELENVNFALKGENISGNKYRLHVERVI